MVAKDSILDEYKNGCRVIRGEERFYVELPDGKIVDFGSSHGGANRKPARLYAALYTQIGPFSQLEDRDKVPVNIATAGKPAIVSYLYASHHEYYNEEYGMYTVGPTVKDRLGEVADVGPNTIQKYFRRVLNEAKEERVGGTAY
jgi:hypothetical protein